ncbi:MAG: SURF1 family protein, partial [Acidimicrobiia bacterium]|nr:SURF1 family protein [Acidimicrobiia bacterium]
LVRSQTFRSEAGFHVITPLEIAEGRFVLVNRGWVPLVMDTPPVAASPPTGEVTELAFIRLSQQRPTFGQTEPPGILTVVPRIDLARIQEQIPGDLAPVWVQRISATADTLPMPLSSPDTSDTGPHVLYAIQWFAFAVIALVGFGFLVRGHSRRGRTMS